jgi:hypothetical protein
MTSYCLINVHSVDQSKNPALFPPSIVYSIYNHYLSMTRAADFFEISCLVKI